MSLVPESSSHMSRSQLVVVGRGKDQPGIALAFMKSLEGHDCQVLDLSQFVLEGLLVFTFVLEVGEDGSFRLMKDLQDNAKQLDMTLDFHFPQASVDQAPADEKRVVLSVCSRASITAATLCSIDEVLSEHGCVVLEIEHRSDNKLEVNGEFNKIQILIRCPPGLSLANLYVGSPTSGGESVGGLQKLIGESVQLTLRVWDAMNRPNGKSLVVFGLSDVLCPYDVLDELVKEAGADPSTVSTETEVLTQVKEKVNLLKGKPATAVNSLINRLEFTSGARMVCSSLKSMGCRLAILTNTGARAVAEHAKQQLGVDYVISQNLSVEDGCFTGEYEGMSDVRFRKLDLLKLMADREGIEYRNVIVVGEPLKGLKSSSIRSLLDTFGAHLYFNAGKVKHLSVILYLLGFSGSHVRALEQRHGDGSKVECPKIREEGCATYLMEVSAKIQKPAQIVQLLGPLRDLGSSVSIDTVRQCSLQNGGMCCGLSINLKDENAERVLKDVVFACQKQDMAVRITEHKNPDNDISTRYFQNRHIITMVQHPEINSSTLKGLFGGLAEEGVNIVRIDRLSLRRLTALQFTVVLPQKLVPEVEFAKFSEKLASLANKNGCDIALQSDDVERLMRRMIVFDMDSTLIQQEVIDELAKIAGVETQVKEITESAMRGEIDFFGSLKRRVALLKGHNADALFSDVKKVIQFNPGAERLCSVLKKLGYKMAVISGGFLPVAEEVQRHLGLDYAFANTLEVDEQTGNLTGQTSGPVVTPTRKRALLATISDVEGCAIKQTIAVGDGANDIPMLHTAGLGIAFCAKPKVQAVSKYRINQKDLSTVLFLIGLSEHAIDRLAEISEDDSNGAPLMPDAKRHRAH
mmetsp:Transcript_37398/g.59211  ORF Transcript_37398/g.59211 Transcript_37398/m.59211 type:complete len:861 (-) Transcript_37398:219-2801(-)